MRDDSLCGGQGNTGIYGDAGNEWLDSQRFIGDGDGLYRGTGADLYICTACRGTVRKDTGGMDKAKSSVVCLLAFSLGGHIDVLRPLGNLDLSITMAIGNSLKNGICAVGSSRNHVPCWDEGTYTMVGGVMTFCPETPARILSSRSWRVRGR